MGEMPFKIFTRKAKNNNKRVGRNKGIFGPFARRGKRDVKPKQWG